MKIAEEVLEAFYKNLSAMQDCVKCSGRGFVHVGMEPDDCTECGGLGETPAYNELQAMEMALKIANQGDGG